MLPRRWPPPSAATPDSWSKGCTEPVNETGLLLTTTLRFMDDPTLFDRRAEVYERGRPPYPAALFERLRNLGLLQPGLRVLDIGAGTGEATGEFIEAGSTVTAIEPGAALARRIAAKWASAHGGE